MPPLLKNTKIVVNQIYVIKSHPVYLGGLHERANPGFDRKSKSNTNAFTKDYCWHLIKVLILELF